MALPVQLIQTTETYLQSYNYPQINQYDYINGLFTPYKRIEVHFAPGADLSLSLVEWAGISDDPAFPGIEFKQKVMFRIQVQGVPQPLWHRRQVNVLTTDKKQTRQPTKARLARLAAQEMSKHIYNLQQAGYSFHAFDRLVLHSVVIVSQGSVQVYYGLKPGV